MFAGGRSTRKLKRKYRTESPKNPQGIAKAGGKANREKKDGASRDGKGESKRKRDGYLSQ